MTVLYFILATLALGILVLVHEAGHFLVARWVGMTVESFSIGFGSAIWKRRIRGVEWRIGWIPFGGYVRIKGMDSGVERDKKVEGSLYDVPGGFYSKSPLKRIAVLFAGPFANVLLAFVVFALLWCCGGRSKEFSEFTKIVGWVSPASELASHGLLPGDRILTCNGSEYVGVKDCTSASLLEGKWDLAVERPNYFSTGSEHFSLNVRCPEREKGAVPVMGASYLIFGKNADDEERSKLLLKESPLEDSSLAVGDRLVWMDGELLFSHVQLSRILNQGYAFLKVRRGDQDLFVRCPRVPAGTLQMSAYVRNELIDSQYEIGLKGKWKSLMVLPYVINAHCYVEGTLSPIDSQVSFPSEYSCLEIGDKILAVDGIPVSRNYDLLNLIQDHKVTLIVENLPSEVREKVYTVHEADNMFVSSIDHQAINQLAGAIGTKNSITEIGTMRVITGVQPLPREKLLPKELFDKQYAWASKIKDRNKKAILLERIEAEKKRLSLGIQLEDISVKYNPNPFILSYNVVADSLKTLKALLMGRLGAKWLSGPIGIIQVLHTGWSLGIGEALFWIGLISMNLAVLNLMPIPALDGSYILISCWELIKRRRLNIKLLEKFLFPFMIFLIFFFLFLTFQDITRIFRG